MEIKKEGRKVPFFLRESKFDVAEDLNASGR